MVSAAPNFTEITDSVLKEASNAHHTFRLLELADFDKGFPELLPQLTVSSLTREAFTQRFNELLKYQDLIQTVVCEDLTAHRVVGTIRYFIEPKYIRNAGTVKLVQGSPVGATFRGPGGGRGAQTPRHRLVVSQGP